MQEKPIALIWGLGPSYRKRVKSTIETALNSGYDNIMEFIILTDVPEDFYELRDTSKKIIDIVNIHEIRKSYPWSEDLEFIPTNQETYGDDFRNYLIQQGKNFTHGLDRFSIPRALELGYTKLVLHDPDTIIHYNKIVSGEIKEEDFWKEFDSPVNSMRGPWKEVIEVGMNKEFIPARAMGSASMYVLQFLTMIIQNLNQKYNKNLYPLRTRFEITESSLKYFHFESVEFGKEWFEVLSDCMKMSYSYDPNFRYLHACGGHMLGDFIPYNSANLYMNMQIIDFYPDIYSTYVFGDDRYFLPIDARLKMATTQEEFYEVNKETIEALAQNNQWPILA